MPIIPEIIGVIRMFDTASTIFRELMGDSDDPPYPLSPPPPDYTAAQLHLEQQRRLVQQWKARAEEAEKRLKRPEPTQTPYTVLGVLETAPDHVIKAAYKAAARRAHEDAGGTNAAMARLNEAYEAIARSRQWKQR